ncbi:MAG: hypothetical protein QF805_13070 [Pirellulaceae bacterium]|nr:hypothetical protein [Pirellulaceae bacterium]
MSRFVMLAVAVAALMLATGRQSHADQSLRIDTPVSPPAWALLERELLKQSSRACGEFYRRYFDERGFLLCVERWGGDDGPDDAIENCNDWPILHALGGEDRILTLYKRAWEGHLRQYTLAKTTQVPFARDGMYYKEFPVMFDWQHNCEGLTVFNLQSLSDPQDRAMHRRQRRYAGFYLNEDPGAPNYDPRHKIIRSLFNGSRGPLLRKATALDWTGDPIEVENRFHLGHGERSYEEMLAHFKDYNDIVGDHPLNLLSTTLALNAYMIDHEPKYREWLLDYVDAWAGRMNANGGVIPSNIGLDGKIGSAADGKWYGGAYGWGFTVTVPQTGEPAHRNRQHWGFIGFANAYLLTGDDRYLQAWRRQADVVNAQMKRIGGEPHYPRMYGDQGWYGYTPEPYSYNAREIWYLSMRASDRRRARAEPWINYLEGGAPGYPVAALSSALASVRTKIAAMRADTTTPDTRLADDPMKFNPAEVTALVQLMNGGIHITRRASVLHCRLRYFDPVRRRAGVPDDVAALVQELSAEHVTVQLVNASQLESREVIVQAGAYAEHEFAGVSIDGGPRRQLTGSHLTVRLAPGSGATLRLSTKRYSRQPTMKFPWFN